jgi:hypothetical protein
MWGAGPEHDPFAALCDDAQTQGVDAVQRLGWRTPSVEAERRNGRGVVAVGLGKCADGVSQGARRCSLGKFRN